MPKTRRSFWQEATLALYEPLDMAAVLAEVDVGAPVGPIQPQKGHAACVEQNLVTIEMLVSAMGADERRASNHVDIVAAQASVKCILRFLENTHADILPIG